MRSILFLFSLLAANQAVADLIWTDREICRAATKTYFWLRDLPKDATDQGQYMGFMSADRHYFTCRVDGQIADLRWSDQSSAPMRSRSTRVEIEKGRLTVRSDRKTERFTRH